MALFEKKEERMVDAIEEGRIVRVSESYALSEGLAILQKHDFERKLKDPEQARKDARVPLDTGFDALRRPLKKSSNDIASTLVENFNWIISQKRRQRGLTRKQLSNSANISEAELKLLENGVVPSRDYIAISRIENFLRISLRKDSQFSANPLKETEEKRQNNSSEKKSSEEDEIEIID